MIRSEWKLSGESFLLDLEVPVGSSALVYLPASDAASIMESGLSVSEEKELTVVGSSEGRVIVKVPSGSYHFQMAKASL
jgi:alpha-L-rhamnosidase